ncbi:hypothetical protein L3V82_08715 [Thiotrichales bacterium 19S3-7]|nr:hypothetical protein [Thiotrichales bacterium 19S3-7]MCF6802199.1 hypothetical protein [Thiotrichales bacterium 19S3-11]
MRFEPKQFGNNVYIKALVKSLSHIYPNLCIIHTCNDNALKKNCYYDAIDHLFSSKIAPKHALSDFANEGFNLFYIIDDVKRTVYGALMHNHSQLVSLATQSDVKGIGTLLYTLYALNRNEIYFECAQGADGFYKRLGAACQNKRNYYHVIDYATKKSLLDKIASYFNLDIRVEGSNLNKKMTSSPEQLLFQKDESYKDTPQKSMKVSLLTLALKEENEMVVSLSK